MVGFKGPLFDLPGEMYTPTCHKWVDLEMVCHCHVRYVCQWAVCVCVARQQQLLKLLFMPSGSCEHVSGILSTMGIMA